MKFVNHYFILEFLCEFNEIIKKGRNNSLKSIILLIIYVVLELLYFIIANYKEKNSEKLIKTKKITNLL